MTNPSQIPVIDVGALNTDTIDKSKISDLASEIFLAYSSTGFGYIINHGIDDDLVERVFDASERFHSLPMSTKMAVELNHLHRGYIPIDTSTDVNSTLAEVTLPNQSESFMVMREDSHESSQVLAGDYLAGPNQWPELDGFRTDIMAYNDAMTEFARKLVGVIAQALNADEYFTNSFKVPTTWLRLLYYPPASNSSLKELEEQGNYGSAPHTDFGCVTLLAQDSIGGLQVQTTDKQWIDVPRLPGSFVMNVGDMLQRWSNGLLKSTPHRVINTSGRARYSCPFFFDPNVTTDIEPLASCVSAESPALYQSINFGDFLKGELTAGYDQHSQDIDSL